LGLVGNQESFRMFKINMATKQLTKLTPLSLGRVGLRDHFEVREWIAQTPAILDEDLSILAKGLILPSCQRLDLLAVDRHANLVIVIVQRDGLLGLKDVDAIKLASWVSNLTPGDIFSLYAEKLGADSSYARARIEAFIATDIEKLNQHQRMIVVADRFPAEMISLVQWWRDSYRLDLKCVLLRLFFERGGELFITSDTVLVPPQAKGFTKPTQHSHREAWRSDTASYSRRAGTFEQPEHVRRLHNAHWRRSEMWLSFVAFLEVLCRKMRSFTERELVHVGQKLPTGHDAGEHLFR